MLTEAGWIVVGSVAQMVLIAIRLVGVVHWPWWAVLAPLEIVGAGVIVLIGYLSWEAVIGGNPFQ